MKPKTKKKSKRSKKLKRSKKIYKRMAHGKTVKIPQAIKIRSYSPSINKRLVSLKKTIAYDVFGCKSQSLNESLLIVNIGNLEKPKCVPYNNKFAIEHLLKNLKASANLDCNKIIPPKQLHSNCWFNTMFMAFFVSDKGRKFFRFFRQLMIEGKQIDGKAIPIDLAKSFFIFNMAIEAAYNLTDHTKKIAYDFDTNLLIKKIHDSIKKDNKQVDVNIRNVKEAGNPLDYYLSIMNYLNNSSINLRLIEYSNNAILDEIIKSVGKLSAASSAISSIYDKIAVTSPAHILVLELTDWSGKAIADKQEILMLKTKYGALKYKLDSIIIRDTSQQHFCAVLTCNGKEMGFDGASYSRMTPFAWKKLINKNKDWTFKADYNLKWNFRNAYQMMFYYRI